MEASAEREAEPWAESGNTEEETREELVDAGEETQADAKTREVEHREAEAVRKAAAETRDERDEIETDAETRDEKSGEPKAMPEEKSGKQSRKEPEEKPGKQSRKEPEEEEDQEIPVVQEWKTEKVRDSRRTGSAGTKVPGTGKKGTDFARRRKAEKIPSDIADILEESKGS